MTLPKYTKVYHLGDPRLHGLLAGDVEVDNALAWMEEERMDAPGLVAAEKWAREQFGLKGKPPRRYSK